MNTNNVTWSASYPPLSDDVILRAERHCGAKFPADYVAFVKVYHGVLPSPNRFDVVVGSMRFASCVGMLLSLDNADGDSVQSAFDNLEGRPDGVVPIAEDGGGDFVCLDYRKASWTSGPQIAYWQRCSIDPEPFVVLAKTFTEFLALLRPAE